MELMKNKLHCCAHSVKLTLKKEEKIKTKNIYSQQVKVNLSLNGSVPLLTSIRENTI